MIAITNDQGLSLVLPADQLLTLERSAGWLADDVLPGAKSYPIEFPLEPNEAFLQSGYRPDSARPRMEFPVTVRLTGVIYRRCLLNYKISEGKGSGYLKIDGGEVFPQLKKLTLQEALPDVIVLTSFFLDPLVLKMGTIARMAPGEFPLTFFPIRNEGFFESDLDETKLPGFVRQPYLNAWGPLPGAPGGYGFQIDTVTKKGYPICPQFYLSWVLERIFARAGYRIDGDWIADPEIQCEVILNNTAISSKSPGLLVGSDSTVTAGQHLPKLSVGDFLKAIRQRYGLTYDFNGDLKTVTIRSFSSVVKTPAVDLTPYIAGKYGIEAPDNKGFSIIDGVDSADELYRDSGNNTVSPAPLLIGGDGSSAEREGITLGVSATQQIYEPSGLGAGKGFWLVPTMRQAGNILDYAYKDTDRYPNKAKPGSTELQLKNETALRIVSYRGLVDSSNGIKYPLGTPDIRDGRQQPIAKRSSSLSGRNGLWRSGLRSFYYFRDQTRPVTVPLDLPVGVAAGLKLSQPVALKLEGQARRTYLLDKLQAQSPGTSGIMQAKAFLLSLPDGLDLSLDEDTPLVWVELIKTLVTNQATYQNNITIEAFSYSLTIKCWTDAQRSSPAIVTSLPIVLRTKQTWRDDNVSVRPDKTYEELQLSYLVNGASTVIEPTFITHYAELPGVNYSVYWDRTVALDPGEDYNIIPS